MGIRFEVGRCEGCQDTETLTNGYCRNCLVKRAMGARQKQCDRCGNYVTPEDEAVGWATCGRRRCRSGYT